MEGKKRGRQEDEEAGGFELERDQYDEDIKKKHRQSTQDSLQQKIQKVQSEGVSAAKRERAREYLQRAKVDLEEEEEQKEVHQSLIEGDFESDDEEDIEIERAAEKKRKAVPMDALREVEGEEGDEEEDEDEEDDYELKRKRALEQGDEVPIEPFNLKKERKEGYFDKEGNYVGFNFKERLRDAWLEELQEKEEEKEKKERLDEEGKKTMSSTQDVKPQQEQPVPSLSALKWTICEHLLDGENVMNALRRLKKEKDKSKIDKPGKKWVKGAKKEPEPASKVEQGAEEKLKEEKARIAFDKLTEAADTAMNIYAYIDVYSDKREKILGSINSS